MPRPLPALLAVPPAPPPTLPPHLASFEPLLERIAQLIRDELRAAGHEPAIPTFVDKHTSGLGPTVFLAAARAGEFDTYRVGKRFVARAADVLAYIERQKLAPRAPAPPQVDELDVQLRTHSTTPSNRVARPRTWSER